MTKLILGLGNIGSEYEKTRHNAGFMVLDAFAASRSLTWQEKSKFKATLTEFSENGEKIILAKPTTYMNHSGETARLIKDFYKIENTDILIIHDELALPFGTLRTRISGSDAGNNGVKSLIRHIGEDFARLRVGILDGEVAIMGAADFVLDRFDPEELEIFIRDTQPKAAELIVQFLAGAFPVTTHK